MSLHKSISSELLDSLFSGARRQNINIEAILTEVGLSDELVLKDETEPASERRIDLDYLGPILRQLWLQMEDEASGFLKRPLKLGMFNMMCHSIITAGNLRRALLRSARFLHLLNEDLSIELQENGDEACLTVHYQNPFKLDSVFFVTSIFVIWIRLSCWLIQRSILLERIQFQFEEPSYHDEFDLMFPCRHKFSQSSNSVTFNKKFLSLPITQNDESLSQFLHTAPESLLTQFRTDNSLSAQIKRQLLHRHGMETELENMTFEAISETLSMTTHTLRRRLKEEGNSFQEIKDSIRRDQALSLLEGHHSLHEISDRLGFSETAAFNRAFKKWTGLTPGAFRNSMSRV
ncbi:MAG: AraC family transcriptional regulator [Oleiphilus sp.]